MVSLHVACCITCMSTPMASLRYVDRLKVWCAVSVPNNIETK